MSLIKSISKLKNVDLAAKLFVSGNLLGTDFSMFEVQLVPILTGFKNSCAKEAIIVWEDGKSSATENQTMHLLHCGRGGEGMLKS